MNICDNIIKDQHIIGIGPLMLYYSSDQAISMLYKRQRYSFELHLTGHTTVIKSEMVDLSGVDDDQIAKNKAHLEDFRKKYFEAREKVKEYIGELAE